MLNFNNFGLDNSIAKNIEKAEILRDKIHSVVNEIENLTGIPNTLILIRENNQRVFKSECIISKANDKLYEEDKYFAFINPLLAETSFNLPKYVSEDIHRYHCIFAQVNNGNQQLHSEKFFTNTTKNSFIPKTRKIKSNQNKHIQKVHLGNTIRYDLGTKKIIDIYVSRIDPCFKELKNLKIANALIKVAKKLVPAKKISHERYKSVSLHTTEKAPVEPFAFFTIKKGSVEDNRQKTSTCSTPKTVDLGMRMATEGEQVPIPNPKDIKKQHKRTASEHRPFALIKISSQCKILLFIAILASPRTHIPAGKKPKKKELRIGVDIQKKIEGINNVYEKVKADSVKAKNFFLEKIKQQILDSKKNT